MGIWLQVVFVFVTILATVLAAITFFVGPCPNGFEPGGSWYEPDCVKCFCSNDGFECQSCGSMQIRYNRKKCYLEGGLYPSCCMPTVVCRGDRRFKPAKMAKAVKTLADKKLKESNLRRVQAAKNNNQHE